MNNESYKPKELEPVNWKEKANLEESSINPYARQYKLGQDYLISELLALDGREIGGFKYNSENNKYEIPKHAGFKLLAASEKYGESFNIDKNITNMLPDVDPEWNEKQAEIAELRLEYVNQTARDLAERARDTTEDNSKYEEEIEEEINKHEKALKRMIPNMKNLLRTVTVKAEESEENGKQKSITTLIDERIISDLNTIQYISKNDNSSESEKIAKISEVLHRVQLAKMLEQTIFGIGFGAEIKSIEDYAKRIRETAE